MEFDEYGRRVVEEQVLLAEYRRRLDRWLPHQYRLRADRNAGAFDAVPLDGWSS